MDENSYRTNVDEGDYDLQLQLIEKGRQLHNHAIQHVLIKIVRWAVTRPVGKFFSGSSRADDVEHIPKSMTAKR